MDPDLEMLARMVTVSTAAFFFVCKIAKVRRRRRGGSLPGKRANIDIDRCAAAARIDADYFGRSSGAPPLFSEKEFERRYRMPRSVYEVLREGVCRADRYFLQNMDAVGVLGATTDQKMAAALRQITLGISADAVVEYCRLKDSTNSECLKRLVSAIVDEFEEEWLRLPREEEMLELETHYAKLGFPGCIGCLDCAGWQWKNCPVVLQGQYRGKEKKSVCRMEVVCDEFLRIWHVMFGSPGAKNDLNILHQSTLFNRMRTGKWPPVRPSTQIGELELNWWYYLTDGLYPRYKIFVQSLGDPKSDPEKRFCAHQEGARKSVERVFGVLFSRFHVLCKPSALWYKLDMNRIVKACCIIQNMICDARKVQYNGTTNVRFDNEEERMPTEVHLVRQGRDTYEQAELWRGREDELENADDHFKLQSNLVKHIWMRAGESL